MQSVTIHRYDKIEHPIEFPVSDNFSFFVSLLDAIQSKSRNMNDNQINLVIDAMGVDEEIYKAENFNISDMYGLSAVVLVEESIVDKSDSVAIKEFELSMNMRIKCFGHPFKEGSMMIMPSVQITVPKSTIFFKERASA